MRRTLAALALAAALSAPEGRAQEPAPEIVTFDQAVARALEQSRDVRRAATGILRAQALLLQARAAVRPFVEGTLAETVIDEEESLDGIVTLPKDQFTASVTGSVSVLDLSGWAARTQAADQEEVARLEEADVRREVAVAAARAYLEVLAQHRQVDVEVRARDTARAQLEYARTRYEGGVGSKLNALRAADVLATDEVRVVRTRLALRLAQEALGVVLAADAPVDVADEPAFDVPPEGAGDWLGTRADIRFFEARRAAAERAFKDSWKDWVPTLDLSFTPRYVDPAGLFEREDSWRAVLAARIPIYDGGFRRSRRQLRQADLRTAEVDLDQAGLRARAEERAARAAVAAAGEGLAAARTAAQHAREVLEITDIAFRAGATTNIELVEAQARARDSETAVASAEDILRRAKLDLLAATGRFPTAP